MKSSERQAARHTIKPATPPHRAAVAHPVAHSHWTSASIHTDAAIMTAVTASEIHMAL